MTQSTLISQDDFETRYRPVPAPGSSNDNGDVAHFFEQVKDRDEHYVWTLVDGEDGGIYALAGIHHVNRINYLVTEVPWVTGNEEAVWVEADDLGEEDEEDDDDDQ